MKTRIEGTKLIIEIDLEQGYTPSQSGKMQLCNDVPRGWNNLAEYAGRTIKGSLNIGVK